MKQANPTVFNTNAADYDNRFDRHPALFQNEHKVW